MTRAAKGWRSGCEDQPAPLGEHRRPPIAELSAAPEHAYLPCVLGLTAEHLGKRADLRSIAVQFVDDPAHWFIGGAGAPAPTMLAPDEATGFPTMTATTSAVQQIADVAKRWGCWHGRKAGAD